MSQRLRSSLGDLKTETLKMFGELSNGFDLKAIFHKRGLRPSINKAMRRIRKPKFCHHLDDNHGGLTSRQADDTAASPVERLPVLWPLSKQNGSLRSFWRECEIHIVNFKKSGKFIGGRQLSSGINYHNGNCLLDKQINYFTRQGISARRVTIGFNGDSRRIAQALSQWSKVLKSICQDSQCVSRTFSGSRAYLHTLYSIVPDVLQCSLRRLQFRFYSTIATKATRDASKEALICDVYALQQPSMWEVDWPETSL